MTQKKEGVPLLLVTKARCPSAHLRKKANRPVRFLLTVQQVSVADAFPLAIKQSRSWLGGWFKREASPQPGPGPVKANLGEQTSFVYDAELKRWVNKKVSASFADFWW
jgi:hypothetical protein